MDDLLKMAGKNCEEFDFMVDQFMTELDALIASKHLLKHPFYQAWSKGQLSRECLQEYAKQYYHHVKAFPTYLSSIHAHEENEEIRQALLKNLIEEEFGSPNHPDLWRAFALAIGVTEEELKTHAPGADIQALISAFRGICKEKNTEEGIAALYAYESQIPTICVSKIEGLKEHYGMHDPKGFRYFSVHIAADEEHAREERTLLEKHIRPQHFEEVKKSANMILDKLWAFLTGLCSHYHITCQA